MTGGQLCVFELLFNVMHAILSQWLQSAVNGLRNIQMYSIHVLPVVRIKRKGWKENARLSTKKVN